MDNLDREREYVYNESLKRKKYNKSQENNEQEKEIKPWSEVMKIDNDNTKGNFNSL